MQRIRLFFVFLTLVFFGVAGNVYAHTGHGDMADLKKVASDNAVTVLTYCKGIYSVTTASGTTHQFKEFDLRFKTDSSEMGPSAGRPAFIKAGMGNDRVFVVFSSLAELKTFPKENCSNSNR